MEFLLDYFQGADLNHLRGFERTQWAGGIFVLAGLSLTPAYVARVTALPFFIAASGTDNPVWWYVAIASLLFLGPSLLVLNGVSTIANTETRRWWLLGSAAASIALLAYWAISNLAGAEVSRAMFVEGCGLALAAAVIFTLQVTRAWIGALIGAVLALPLLLGDVQFVFMGAAYSAFGFQSAIAVAAVALWLGALICAIWIRSK
jgi:hypothetical protein